MGKKRDAQRVPVSPEIVCLLKANVTAAYYYAQLLYYAKYEQDADGWFSKNTREIKDDIGLNRHQQQYSREILEKKGWIETRSITGGAKPTVMFRVLVDYYKQ